MGVTGVEVILTTLPWKNALWLVKDSRMISTCAAFRCLSRMLLFRFERTSVLGSVRDVDGAESLTFILPSFLRKMNADFRGGYSTERKIYLPSLQCGRTYLYVTEIFLINEDHNGKKNLTTYFCQNSRWPLLHKGGSLIDKAIKVKKIPRCQLILLWQAP